MLASDNRQVLSSNSRHQNKPDKRYTVAKAFLHSPGYLSKVACFVQIPPAEMSPQSQPPYNTGTKRKRLHRRRSTIANQRNNLRGIPAPRQNKPVSVASDASEWSSLASLSPSTSHFADLNPEIDQNSGHEYEHDPDLQYRAHHAGSSQQTRLLRSSLHSTMDRMSLYDLPDPSSPKLTRSSSSSKPKVSESQQSTKHADSSSSQDQDTQDEDQRLLLSAPTWQLHRLKKHELMRLNQLAGNWDSDSLLDPEQYTKQELVNGIIVCRSRLDKSSQPKVNPAKEKLKRTKSSPPCSTIHYDYETGRSRPRPSTASGSGSGSDSQPSRPAHRDRLYQSPSSSDESNQAGGEETEAEFSHKPYTQRDAKRRASNPTAPPTASVAHPSLLRRMDSFGLEEFEPLKPSHPPPTHRQLRARSMLSLADKKSIFTGRSSCSKVDSNRRNKNGSDLATGSTSSLSATLSRTSSPKYQLRNSRSRLNLHVASSPTRTRSRTHNQANLQTRRRPFTRAAAAMMHDNRSLPSHPAQAATRRGRGRSRSRKIVTFGQPEESNHPRGFGRANGHQRSVSDDWVEEIDGQDHSPNPTVQVSNRRQAKNRSRKTDQETEDNDADGELTQDQQSLQSSSDGAGDTDDDGMAVKTTRGKKGTRIKAGFSQTGQSRTDRRRSSLLVEPANSRDLDDDDAIFVDVGSHYTDTPDDDDTEDESSSCEPDSPIKFRKLRNGKLRLPVVEPPQPRRASDQKVSKRPLQDVEMSFADEPIERQDEVQRERGSTPQEDVMLNPTATLLNRFRRAQLVDLCGSRDIETDDTDRKVDLVQRLLDWHEKQQQSSSVTDPDATINQDDFDSDTSAATAKQMDHEPTSTAIIQQRTRTSVERRSKSSELDTADEPLLLKTRAGSSTKVPTPPLTSGNKEARLPEPEDGVDELNGLDLESLNLVDKEIPAHKLEKLEKIGSGGFKDVYVGKYHISKARVNKVAIADIRDQLTEMDIKELTLLRDLKHENIVRFIGVSIPEDPRSSVPCMIVSELCPNGDLFDYIRNTEAPNDAQVFRILLEIARGLEYLHTRTPSIIHRDCKSTNVLITRNKTAKINDFGLARVKNTSRSMVRSLVGTVNWQAAELWVPKPHYNEKVDVWSAAMTFWETLQWHQSEKKYPFQGMNDHQIYLDVGQKKQRPYTGSIRRQFGGEIVDLLDRMWDHTPKNRPSMSEVCSELEKLFKLKKATARKS